jgi:hypothetical protein
MADKREHDAEAQRPFLAGESSEDVLQKMKVVEEDEPKAWGWTAWARLVAEVMMAGAIVVLLLRAWQHEDRVEEKLSPVPTCMLFRLLLGIWEFWRESELTRRRAEDHGDVSTKRAVSA